MPACRPTRLQAGPAGAIVAEEPHYLLVHRADDPDGWLTLCYTNTSITTQVDDGHPDEQGRGCEPMSSSSMPSVVAEMLAALQVEPGMWVVLEIGTGTGWNAALMAYRLGAQNVTTLEIDPAVAEHERAEHREGMVRWTMIRITNRRLAKQA